MAWIELNKTFTSGSGKVLINTDTIYAIEQSRRKDSDGKELITTEVHGHGFYPTVSETYEEVKALLEGK